MQSADVEHISMIMSAPLYVERALYVLLGVAAVVGGVLAATTRPDAFEAANRQSKTVWVAILAVSAFALFLRLPFIAWFGAVAVGIYFFDVRPQITNILRGNYGW